MNGLDYEDLRKVVWLSAPKISPDGKTALYVRATSDYRTGKNIGRAMEISMDSGKAMLVSAATLTQSSPAYSPDGSGIAFLSGENGILQLWLKDRASGAESQLTHLRYGVSAFAFSSDGSCVAIETKFFPERAAENIHAEMTTDELSKFINNRKDSPRIAENLIYKYDDSYGFIEKSVSIIGILNTKTGALEIISPCEYACLAPSFSGDSRYVYFYSRPYKHEKERRLAICRYDLTEKQFCQLENEALIYSQIPIVEHDGEAVYVGFTMGDDSWLAEPYTACADKVSNKCLFTGAETCHGVDALIIGDNHMGDMGSPLQRGDDSKLYFLSVERGVTGVYRLESGNVARVTSGTGCICSFSAPACGKMVYLRSHFNRPCELYALDMATGVETRLTFYNDWMQEYCYARPYELEIPTNDGKGRVHGWVMLPKGQEKCPGVLYVHGGPEAFYAEDGLFFDAQMICARGMAAIYCDPRGSTGYGRAHMSEKCAWGVEAMDDLHAFLDAAIAKYPRIDGAHLGVTGGSYGGYMTNKLTINCQRFKAAVAQRTFIDPATSYGTGDMGFISGSGKTDFRQYMIDRARQSMLKDIMNINAPMLILHGEQDLRCGVEQADQLFVMLRALKPELPARLVIFPGENHNVTRAGLMHNQIRHLREMTEWLVKYLSGEVKGVE